MPPGFSWKTKERQKQRNLLFKAIIKHGGQYYDKNKVTGIKNMAYDFIILPKDTKALGNYILPMITKVWFLQFFFIVNNHTK